MASNKNDKLITSSIYIYIAAQFSKKNGVFGNKRLISLIYFHFYKKQSTSKYFNFFLLFISHQ
jgi:hypothetical protein